jgi:hypothetical protein
MQSLPSTLFKWHVHLGNLFLCIVLGDCKSNCIFKTHKKVNVDNLFFFYCEKNLSRKQNLVMKFHWFYCCLALYFLFQRHWCKTQMFPHIHLSVPSRKRVIRILVTWEHHRFDKTLSWTACGKGMFQAGSFSLRIVRTTGLTLHPVTLQSDELGMVQGTLNTQEMH